jgi:hypothetical protein
MMRSEDKMSPERQKRRKRRKKRRRASGGANPQQHPRVFFFINRQAGDLTTWSQTNKAIKYPRRNIIDAARDELVSHLLAMALCRG